MSKKIVTTVCRLCPAGCGMNVTVEGNRVCGVEGLPEDPRSKGHLCPKGKASPDILYAPDRILRPLRRRVGKGEDQWDTISWDEALDEIVSKFQSILDSDGPPSISVYRGQASDWGASWLYCLRFMNVLGSPNIITTSHLCYVPRTIAHVVTYGGMVEPDFDNTNCLIVWGANTTQTNERAPLGQLMFDAKARGAKLIVIDPIRTELARKSDKWLQLKPGTDCSLALGMLRVIVEDGLYDREFVKNWCIGFEELSLHLRDYTLDSVSEITGVPAQEIEETARMFATAKPAAIFDGNGLDQHLNVVQTVRAICLLRAVTGNIERKGGDVFNDTLSVMANDIKLQDRIPYRMQPIGGYKFYYDMAKIAPPPPVFDAILTGEPYPIRALVVQGGNPLITLANTHKMERALRKLEFLVVMDFFMTQTARFADIFLPAATFLETTGLTAYPGMRTNYPILMQKVIEPLGQSWPDWKLWFTLAKRLEMGKDFPWKDVDEAIDYQLEPTGFKAEHLKGRLMFIPRRYEKFKERGFFTASKKVELFSNTMANYGFDPLPKHLRMSDYIPNFDEKKMKYPLLGTNMPRPAVYTHTQFRNIPALRKGDPDPLIFLHPKDASKRGISDGEQARMETELGSITRKVKITDSVQPGVAALNWGWGEAILGTGDNEIINDDIRDPMCGATSNRLFLCEVKRC